MGRGASLVALAALAATALVVSGVAPGVAGHAAGSGKTGSPLAAGIQESCPVTLPNGDTPPRAGNVTFGSDTETPPDDETRTTELPSPEHHGDGRLWTILRLDGVLRAGPREPTPIVHPDGSIQDKFPWWRGPGVTGALTIEGRRLDASATPLRAFIPEGYGDTGFQATGITFPSEGCWEVTGRAGDAELTFVVLVVRTDRS